MNCGLTSMIAHLLVFASAAACSAGDEECRSHVEEETAAMEISMLQKREKKTLLLGGGELKCYKNKFGGCYQGETPPFEDTLGGGYDQVDCSECGVGDDEATLYADVLEMTASVCPTSVKEAKTKCKKPFGGSTCMSGTFCVIGDTTEGTLPGENSFCCDGSNGMFDDGSNHLPLFPDGIPKGSSLEQKRKERDDPTSGDDADDVPDTPTDGGYPPKLGGSSLEQKRKKRDDPTSGDDADDVPDTPTDGGYPPKLGGSSLEQKRKKRDDPTSGDDADDVPDTPTDGGYPPKLGGSSS